MTELTEAEARIIARRVMSWPAAFQQSHFYGLEPETRRLVAEVILELDGRPELAPEPQPEPEPEHDPGQEQLFEAGPAEPPEPTWADWKGRDRELPPDAIRLRDELRARTEGRPR